MEDYEKKVQEVSMFRKCGKNAAETRVKAQLKLC
jgi:hypothetical protein